MSGMVFVLLVVMLEKELMEHTVEISSRVFNTDM